MRWLLSLLLALPVASQNSFELVKDRLSELSLQSLAILSEDVGKMCEFVAAKMVEQEFDPNKFFLMQNLTYGKGKRKVTGELDIVVFSKLTKLAVKLYEVKCRISEEDAYEEAVKQLKRFENNVERCLRSRQAISITDGIHSFPCSAFENMQYSVLMPKDLRGEQSPAEHFDLSLAQIYRLQAISKEWMSKP